MVEPRTPLWRSTPPAVFPVALGFMGLGLAWRNAAGAIGTPHEIGDLLLGAATAFYLFFLALYLVKTAARPWVLMEDMVTPPARAGIAALAMTMILLAAALLPFGLHVPEVWVAGIFLLFLQVIVVLRAILGEPPETRAYSPFQYMTFVGPVVAPVAGIPLGYSTASFWLAMFALVTFTIITVGYGRKLIKVRPPVPLRPSLAIALAPVSLFGLTFGMLDMEAAFLATYGLAWLLALALLVCGPWMMRGGWTPIWGAFTFPVATFTNLQVLALAKGIGTLALVGIWAGLAIGTPLILFVLYRTGMAWITGELAKKSGAATA